MLWKLPAIYEDDYLRLLVIRNTELELATSYNQTRRAIKGLDDQLSTKTFTCNLFSKQDFLW